MSKKFMKILGIVLSVIGLLLIVANAVDYLGGYHRIPGDVSLFGLLMAVIGMYLNKKYLLVS